MTNRKQSTGMLRAVMKVLPVSVLLLGFAAKVFTMQAINVSGIQQYEQQWYYLAGERFQANRTLNFFAPWVAPFNRGTAMYQERNWSDAEQDFRAALAGRPGGHRCQVTLNLVWTLESRGDEQAASGQETAARSSWQAAQYELAASGCQNRPDAEREAEDQTRVRLDEKLQQESTSTQQDPTPSPSPPSPSQSPTPSSEPSDAEASRASELEERNREGQRHDREMNEDNELPGNPVERPW